MDGEERNVVYVIMCNGCNKNYMGEQQTLKAASHCTNNT